MTLSPRARFGLRIFGYVALAVFAFVYALHLTFPYHRVKDKIEEALATKYDVVIGGVERSIMPGRFSLTAVTLRSRPTVANEAVTTMYFKRVEVDIAFLPLLSKKVEIGLDVATPQGSMAGTVRLSKQATSIDFRLRNVPLATIPGIGDAVGLPLFGNGDGAFSLDLPTGDWSKAKGKLDLSCKVGCVIGDGVTRIYPKAKRESDQAFVKDGTVVPEIKITRFELGIDIAKGEAKRRKFEMVSPDGEAQLDFTIKLAKKIGDSTIVGCISYKCSDALKTRWPKFAGTCDFSSPAIDSRGFHDIKLTGKLTSMRRIGATCATDGEDSTPTTGGGVRSRPTLDSEPVRPVEPTPLPALTPPPVDMGKPVGEMGRPMTDPNSPSKTFDNSADRPTTGQPPPPGSAEMAPPPIPPPAQDRPYEPPPMQPNEVPPAPPPDPGYQPPPDPNVQPIN